ncbi:hypothetical protein PSI23_21590 [Xenorhabdus sp. XENO-10]|uniref:Inner membrane protein n=1 Tax=Xenorhabdus yunnanensis TaxID=3025878 RepID=A0ABT5LL15_9GAMM|nr:hypothetical protein [Xenorhabdus yunnanensis]MDC9591799.1 hypothetical protein [Xenorhabdus yunnanensis]
MSIILGSMIYVIGFIAAFIIFTLIEKKRANDPEDFGVILFASIIWPIGVIVTPIVFGCCLLGKKYNQIVGKQ